MSDAAVTQDEKDPLAPSIYTVRVTHSWDGELEVAVEDVKDTPEGRKAVAWALRHGADMLERGETRMHRKPDAPANVVSLRGGDFDCVPREEPDAGLLKAVAKVFQMARDGKLRSFMGTGFMADGARMKCFGGAIGADVYQMLGALTWLEHEYVDRIARELASGTPPPTKGAG